jgi:site-specific recombinase XerD
MGIVHFEFRKSQSKKLASMGLGTLSCIIRVNGTEAKPFSLTTIGNLQKEAFNSKTKEIIGDVQKTEMLRQMESGLLRLHNLYPDFTADQLKGIHQQGRQHQSPLLLDLYAQFFEEFELIHDNEESIRTYRLNETAMKKYLAHLKRPNYTTNEVNEAFLIDFQIYLKSVCRNFPITIAKRSRFLKRVLSWAVSKGILDKNPLQYIRFPIGKYKEQVILDMDELRKIEDLQTTNPTLCKVKALFLFQCYTGLSDTDMRTFDYQKNVKFIDEVESIVGNRNKTNVAYVLPFLPKAKAIYEENGSKLPLIKQQPYNRFLKELGALAGIDKVLTSHVGRRTAGSYFLANGVRMETVSKMLGHASIRETERVYAKLFDKQVISETKHLRELK